MKRRGVTLSETLIAATVMGILLSAIAMSLTLAESYFRGGMNDETLQADAQLALRRMTSEMQNSSPQLWANSTSPEGFVFASPQGTSPQFDLTPQGQLMYQNWVCYYQDTGSLQLMRASLPIASPSNYPIPIPTVAQMVAQPGPMIIANNLTSLLFTVSGSTVTIHMTLQYGTDTELQVGDAVRMRNMPH